MSTAEIIQQSKFTPTSRMIRKRRLRLVGHVVRAQSTCHAPLGTSLTTVPSNCHLRQHHGKTVALQHSITDDLWPISRDMTSIASMKKSCFLNLVDTVDRFVSSDPSTHVYCCDSIFSIDFQAVLEFLALLSAS